MLHLFVHLHEVVLHSLSLGYWPAKQLTLINAYNNYRGVPAIDQALGLELTTTEKVSLVFSFAYKPGFQEYQVPTAEEWAARYYYYIMVIWRRFSRQQILLTYSKKRCMASVEGA